MSQKPKQRKTWRVFGIPVFSFERELDAKEIVTQANAIAVGIIKGKKQVIDEIKEELKPIIYQEVMQELQQAWQGMLRTER